MSEPDTLDTPPAERCRGREEWFCIEEDLLAEVRRLRAAVAELTAAPVRTPCTWCNCPTPWESRYTEAQIRAAFFSTFAIGPEAAKGYDRLLAALAAPPADTAPYSGRWCDLCNGWTAHHTDRHEAFNSALAAGEPPAEPCVCVRMFGAQNSGHHPRCPEYHQQRGERATPPAEQYYVDEWDGVEGAGGDPDA